MSVIYIITNNVTFTKKTIKILGNDQSIITYKKNKQYKNTSELIFPPIFPSQSLSSSPLPPPLPINIPHPKPSSLQTYKYHSPDRLADLPWDTLEQTCLQKGQHR